MCAKKYIFFISIYLLSNLFGNTPALAANQTLEITLPRPNASTHSRYAKAYPGLEYRVPIGVYGGLYPFTYSLTTYPGGMTIDEDSGIITWSNPTTEGSPHRVTIQVVDDEGSTDSVSWTITVTTSGFIFLDPDAGDGGDGTIGSPLNELGNDVLGSNSDNTAYNDYFLYFRGGTHEIDDGLFSGCPGLGCRVEWRPGARHPHVWLEYPGETAIIDHDLGRGGGAYFMSVNDDNDMFFHGIRFQDMGNHAIRSLDDNSVVFECEFINGGPGQDGWNSSFIMYTGKMIQNHPYVLLKDNVFDNFTGHGAFVKTYGTWKAVIEGNTFQNPGSGSQGLAIKEYDQYMSVRGNTFDGDFGAASIGGNNERGRNYEFSFNKVINAGNDSSRSAYGAIALNKFGNYEGPIWVHRNTFEGTAHIFNTVPAAGPVYIYNNVIVNENAFSDDPVGSLITNSGVSMAHANIGTDVCADCENIVGAPSDRIIDANGDLVESYFGYVGSKGYQISRTDNIQPPPLAQFPLAPQGLRVVVDQ